MYTDIISTQIFFPFLWNFYDKQQILLLLKCIFMNNYATIQLPQRLFLQFLSPIYIFSSRFESFATILYFLLIQRLLLLIMQILFSNHPQRNSPSKPLEELQDLNNFLSRSSHVHESNIKHKIKQKMRQQLQILSSQLYRLSPEKSIDCTQQFITEKISHATPSYYPHQNASSIQMAKTFSRGLGPLSAQQRYTLNVPVQIILQNQNLQDVDENDTGQIMDRQFNKLLEINCNTNEDLSLDIESKFVVIKSQKRIKDAQLYQPDKIYFNSYEYILKEENYYLREQLIQFTKDLDHLKAKNNEFKLKHKNSKKENIKLVKQIEDLHEITKFYDTQLNKKNEQCAKLTNQHEQDIKLLESFDKHHHLVEKRLFQIQQECQNHLMKLEESQFNRQKEIESLMQENGKIKEVYQEQICQKQKEISQLNDFIAQLKTKIASLQKQNININTDEHSHSSRAEQQSRLFEDGTNSICLSLAEAQSLKNIIEEKEQMHKAQLLSLNQQHEAELQKIKKELEMAQTRLMEIEKKNAILSQQISNNQRKYHSNTFPISTQSIYFDDQSKGLDKQDLIQINFNRRIKKLERQLAEEHQQKMQLLNKITQLQEHGCKEREQDEQLEQLLQKCVNELQKERQLNHALREEMEYLRMLLSKQQGLGKERSQIYN